MGINKFLKRLLNKPTFDKIFYVPFWDCPYLCDFCCVDSLPGNPSLFPDDGEEILFQLIDELYSRHQNPIEFHLYGGEPMLRKRYVEHLAEKVSLHSSISRFYLYTTLRSNSPKGVMEILGSDMLTIIVNPDTVNDKVKNRLNEFEKVVVMYNNPVFFPTGRGAVGLEGNQKNFWQSALPIGLPARSCFAASSGMLVNGQQGTIHLCCLPQSPIIGTFDDCASLILDKYETAAKQVPRELNRQARKQKCVHPCQVCNSRSGYQSTAGKGCNSFTLEKIKELENVL